MTLGDLEKVAKQRSEQGMRLKLEEAPDGWEWHWSLKNLPGVFSHGTTTAKTKPVAFVMALGLL